MIEIEKTVVKLAVINDMLGTVKPLIEEARGKVRTWLKSKTVPDALIEDTFHAYLQVSLEKTDTVPDDQAAELEFSGLVKAGRYTQAELQDLISTGQLVFADPSLAKSVVALRIKGYIPPMKTVVTPASDPDSAPLKILAKPNARFDGLRTLVRGVGDIRPIVSRILEAPLPVPPAAPVPAGAVALQRTRKK